MTFAHNWANIPLELRQKPQWCYTCPSSNPQQNKAPRKVGNSFASVVNPSEWMTFELACENALKYKGAIGYVLTEDDNFTCIDLDVKDASNQPDPTKWTTQVEFDRFWHICNLFSSYTESSYSGKGLHIWLHGKIGSGLRRDGVEIYSQERFIICTGKIVINKPIIANDDLLHKLAKEISKTSHTKILLDEEEEEISDWELIDIALSAGNAEKFDALCKCTSNDPITGELGSYTDLNYQSQSEADLALMSIFTFYSKSNEQCRRLFRATGLGKREKAIKDDRYLNLTLQTIRSRQANEANIELSSIAKSTDLLMQLQQDKKDREATLLHVPTSVEPIKTPAPPSSVVSTFAPLPPQVSQTESSMPWPPGMAGQIAQFVYQSAPRPVKEIAIVAALGFLAGVCGKAFCIPQSGLNLYIVLVARSAVGKEAMHSGVSALIAAAASRQPPAVKFVDFNDFASGPALSKAVAANPSFVNVAGEFGKKLKRLAVEDGRDTPMSALRTVMTNLYQKSGPQSIVGGISYSNKDSNVGSVTGVAYSMIGESTPGTFYDSLTQGMMEDGFLSRFTIIEYTGERPHLNTTPQKEPSKALGDAIADLCTHAITLLDRHDTVMVSRTNDAAIAMQKFELECDTEINRTFDEMWRQMWNRASLKMMRLSALLAVADNWLNPVIEMHHIEWALDVIRRDIAIMASRIQSGDIGTDDDARERKIAMLMKEYLEHPVADSYGIPDILRQNAIIPRKYVQVRSARMSAFTSHRGGATQALDMCFRSLVDSGYIIEVDKAKMVEKFNFHGKAYRIISMPNYSARTKQTKK